MPDTSLPMLAGMPFGSKAPINDTLGAIVAALAAYRLAGYVQFRGKDPASTAQLVYYRALFSGYEQALTQNRGPFARACKLDSNAMVHLATRLEQHVLAGPDALIIARFGRTEAEGGGLRDVISTALHRNIPTLVAIRGEYQGAWEDYHGGLAHELPLDVDVATRWLSAAIKSARKNQEEEDAKLVV